MRTGVKHREHGTERERSGEGAFCEAMLSSLDWVKGDMIDFGRPAQCAGRSCLWSILFRAPRRLSYVPRQP